MLFGDGGSVKRLDEGRCPVWEWETGLPRHGKRGNNLVSNSNGLDIVASSDDSADEFMAHDEARR